MDYIKRTINITEQQDEKVRKNHLNLSDLVRSLLDKHFEE